MSEAIKPTTEKPWSYVPEGQMIVMGGDITRMIADVRGWGWLQKLPKGAAIQDANGRLIAEAGTVRHETGLTPRQLADLNAELVEALQEMVERFEPNAWGSNDNRVDALINARAVLAKVNTIKQGDAHE